MHALLAEALERRGRTWGQTKGTADRDMRPDERPVTQVYGWGTENSLRIVTQGGAFRRVAPPAE